MALNASSHVVVLDVRVKGGNQAAAAMQKTGAATEQAGVKAEKTKREFASLAGAFTALFAAGMVRRGFESLVKPAVEFDTAMTRLRTITGATDREMGLYERRARAVAALTPYGPTEMVTALQELRRATGDTDVALAALEGTAKIGLASMGKMGLEGATRMTTETIKTFGLQAAQIPDAMERIASLALAAGQNIEGFQTVMARLGTVATATGQSLDQVMMAAVLSGRGIAQPARNVQLLSSALKMLQQEKARAAMEGIGVEIIDPLSGSMRNLTDIFTDMSTRMMSEPSKVRQVIVDAFGQRGGESVLSILNQLTGAFGKGMKGGQVFAHLREEIRKSGGTLDEMGRKYVASAAGQFELFNEKVGDLQRSLGTTLIPMFVSLARILGPIAQGFSAIVNNPVGKFIFQGAGSTLAVLGGAWALKALWFGISKIFMNVASNIGLIAVNAKAATTALGTMAGAGAAAAGGATAAAGAGRLATLGRGAVGAIPLGIGLATEGLASYFGGLGESIVEKLKKGETLSWWENIWWKGGRKMLNEDQLKVLDQQIGKYKEVNKELELAVRHKKDAHEIAKLDLAGYRGAAGYKPPVAEASAFTALETRLRSAGKQAGGADKRSIDDALRAASTARTLWTESTKGPLSSIKHGQLLNALETMQVVGTDINMRRGGIGGNVLERFGKKAMTPWSETFTPENQRFMRVLMRARGMQYPLPGEEQVPGTSAASAGFGAAPGAMLMRDFPWHSKSYPTQEQQRRTRVEAIAQQSLTEAEHQRRVMEQIRELLSQPLKVESSRKDPMGGQSQPDFFPG